MKGQIAIIEAVISAIALFIAFNMIITVQEYQTKWEDSLSLMQGRDALVTADRLGTLHDYPFSPAFETQLLSKLDAIKDDIVKNETRGTVRSAIYVACDCTSEQQSYVQNILKDVKFNTREITGIVCPTTLPAINPCGSGGQYPDGLIIWGYRLLDSDSVAALTNYAKEGGGIIEIADLDENQASNPAQQTIFGIKWTAQGNFPPDQIQFLTPRNASPVTYQSYKWFHHLPYNFTLTQDAPSFQMESGATVACDGKTGSLKFQDDSYQFWVCTNNRVYFDTDQPQNVRANTDNSTGEVIPISVYKFKLNYIDGTSKIRISFKPSYLFNDFLFIDETHNKIYPLDNDASKILLNKGYWDVSKNTPIASAILNRFEGGVTAWMPDFSRVGLANTGDDHKQLLSSLMFSVVNKLGEETSQTGQVTSYINVNSTDMLEIYRIDLIIGKPF